jgi:hypothetical protein
MMMSAQAGPADDNILLDVSELSSTDSSSQQSRKTSEPVGSSTKSASLAEDFTLIPKILDAKLEQYDTEGALKSTIVKADRNWIRSRQENLLVAPETTTLRSKDVDSERIY